MTDIDAEIIAHDLLETARLLGCAPAELLAPQIDDLVLAQAEIARAISKAQLFGRKAA